MEIDTEKIGLFLKSMNGAEYIYLQHCMEMRNGISSLIKRHNLSKEDVCERFKIEPEIYDDYVKGNYNYSIMDMARLNAAFMALEVKKLEENVPVKVSSKPDQK
jgi:hypothetical protein